MENLELKTDSLKSVNQLSHLAIIPPIKYWSNRRGNDFKNWPENNVDGYSLGQMTVYTEPVKPEIVKCRRAIGIKGIHSVANTLVTDI